MAMRRDDPGNRPRNAPKARPPPNRAALPPKKLTCWEWLCLRCCAHPPKDRPLVEENEDKEAAERRHLKYLFLGIFLSQAMLNFDTGALPASLDSLKAWRAVYGEELSYTEQGLLGALAYVGLTISCIFAGKFLQVWKARNVLAAALGMNTLFCYLFAVSPEVFPLMIARFGVGLSQAFLVIYFPVWVDEFAPEAKKTQWLSLLHVGVPLGVMMGYVCAGYVSSEGDMDWRFTFYFQSFALTPLALLVWFVPPELVERSDPMGVGDEERGSVDSHASKGTAGEAMRRRFDSIVVAERSISVAQEIEMAREMGPVTDKERKEEEAKGWRERGNTGRSARSDKSGGVSKIEIPKSQLGQYWMVIKNPLYISVVFALSALYFVVTGIQFWATEYLLQVIHAPKTQVVTGFALTSATAPVFGVLFGGWMTDKLGGYKGHAAVFIATKTASVFALLAVACALPVTIFTEFYAVVGFLWMLLFFGGGILPPATGVMISAVPPPLRSIASAVSMLAFNFLGYSLGPLLSGVCASMWDLTFGFRIVLGWSVWGLFFMMFAGYFARSNAISMPDEQTRKYEQSRRSFYSRTTY